MRFYKVKTNNSRKIIEKIFLTSILLLYWFYILNKTKMPCKKKELSPEIIEKVKNFFQENTDKSYKAWEIVEKLGLEKDDVSKAIKKLKDDGVIAWRCVYKLA